MAKLYFVDSLKRKDGVSCTTIPKRMTSHTITIKKIQKSSAKGIKKKNHYLYNNVIFI